MKNRYDLDTDNKGLGQWMWMIHHSARTKSTRSLWLKVLCLGLFLSGMPQSALAEQASLGPAIAQQTQQVVNESTHVGEQKRKQFFRYLRSQIDEFDGKLEEIKTQSDELREQARSQLLERLDRLEARKQELLPQIEKASRTSEAAWEDIKDGLNRAASDLKVALEQAASNFF